MRSVDLDLSPKAMTINVAQSIFVCDGALTNARRWRIGLRQHCWSPCHFQYRASTLGIHKLEISGPMLLRDNSVVDLIGSLDVVGGQGGVEQLSTDRFASMNVHGFTLNVPVGRLMNAERSIFRAG